MSRPVNSLPADRRVERIRKDFPILRRKVHGQPLVYLDNAATSQKPESVIRAIDDYYRRYNSNAHRGVHTLAEEATTGVENARARIARFIGAPDPAAVIFTRNCTEAVNLVAHGYGRKFLKPGDEILLTDMEHHSNIVPWYLLARATGAVIQVIPVTEVGRLDLEAADRMITAKTRLVAVTQMSNVLGTINPVERLIRSAHAAGAVVLIDGAQGVPHLPVNVEALDCDFLAFSGHKMLGPTGIGVLYGKRSLLEKMDPFLGGGDMIREVSFERITWNDLPHKFEAGTPHMAGAIGLAAAVDYLDQFSREALQAQEGDLIRYALSRFQNEPDVTLYGPQTAEARGAVFSFTLEGVPHHDLGTILDSEGVAIRAGHHCCQPLMRRLGVSGTARASLYLYNTREEIDRLFEGLEKARRIFGLTRHAGKTPRPARPKASL